MHSTSTPSSSIRIAPAKGSKRSFIERRQGTVTSSSPAQRWTVGLFRLTAYVKSRVRSAQATKFL
jgi:hypothetical protein